MFAMAAIADRLAWARTRTPGVLVKVLFHDLKTGAMSVLTRLDPGATVPAHCHAEADEAVYVLEGDFVENGFLHTPGTLFFGRAGTPHGPHHSVGGCQILSHFSAPVDPLGDDAAARPSAE